MNNGIRIYVEGGGDSNKGKKAIRNGFNEFFGEIKAKVREKNIRWDIIACGPRNDAFGNFCHALETHPESFNILLVDSEGPLTKSTWEHLKDRDNWNKPDTEDENCHLMVQAMEAWLIADIEALKEFYGQGFNENPIPIRSNVEEIDKTSLKPALKTATRNTQKGEYHEIRHAPRILSRLNVEKVRKAADHCEILFNTLEGKIGEC